MRLLNVITLELEEFARVSRPKYAILSHTWGTDEVSYQEMKHDRSASEKKAGFAKIEFAASQAKQDGLNYLWVDTCCIDKDSSAELSEAINSMYSWYEKATVCYAHLEDVYDTDQDHP